MSDRNESTRRAQQLSLLNAEAHRQPWDGLEVELISDDSATAAELAELLGRTVYAVQSARHLLAQGATLGGGQAPVGAGTRTPAQRAATPWAADDPRWG